MNNSFCYLKDYRLASFLVWITCSVPTHASTFTFAGLGDLDEGYYSSYVEGISGNGKVIVGGGWANYDTGTSVVWKRENGVIRRYPFDLTDSLSFIRQASNDGTVLVGNYRYAAKWINGGSPVELGYLGSLGAFECCTTSSAVGVSANGSVIVGYSTTETGWEAFRWTENEGMVGLGFLPNGGFNSGASSVSADGTKAVGYSQNLSGSEAVRWNEDGSIETLGQLPGGTLDGLALQISADGRVVVGYSDSSFGQQAFRWTEADGMVGLGDLPGGRFLSSANDLSGDGSVVVGRSFSEQQEAFIWTEKIGMQNLRNWLITQGTTGLDGWRLISATGISDDGKVIVGTGRNPHGNNEGWIVTVPEPSAMLLLSLAAIGLITRRGRS